MGFIKKIFRKPTYVFSEKDLRWNKFIDEICSKEFFELNDFQKNVVVPFWYHAHCCNGGHLCYIDDFPEINPRELSNALILHGFSELADNFQQAVLNGEEDEYVNADENFGNMEDALISHLMEYVELHHEKIFHSQ